MICIQACLCNRLVSIYKLGSQLNSKVVDLNIRFPIMKIFCCKPEINFYLHFSSDLLTVFNSPLLEQISPATGLDTGEPLGLIISRGPDWLVYTKVHFEFSFSLLTVLLTLSRLLRDPRAGIGW